MGPARWTIGLAAAGLLLAVPSFAADGCQVEETITLYHGDQQPDVLVLHPALSGDDCVVLRDRLEGRRMAIRRAKKVRTADTCRYSAQYRAADGLETVTVQETDIPMPLCRPWRDAASASLRGLTPPLPSAVQPAPASEAVAP